MSIEHQIIVHTHIEKTAGTSVLAYYAQLFSANTVLIYDARTKKLLPNSDSRISRTNPTYDQLRKTFAQNKFWPMIFSIWSKVNKYTYEKKAIEPKNIPSDSKVVIGHFQADYFDTIIRNPFRTIIIRNPLDRMWSQYQHWFRNHGVMDWRVTVPFNPSMSFIEYAFLPELRNYQSGALGNKDLREFDVVGVTEYFNLFCTTLISVFKDPNSQAMSQTEIKQFNEAPKPSSPSLSENERIQFQQFHSKDYDLFQQALSIATTTK